MALFAWAMVVVAAPALPQSNGLVGEVDAIVSEAMERSHIAGVAVGISKGDDVVLAKGYGLADVENDVAVDAHTVFRIGSVTKQFTAAAILLLVERGKLSLDTELGTLLPDYPTHGRTITVERLLNHTSGIKGYTEMPSFWETARLDLSQEEMMSLFGAEPFEFAPGEKYQYNNSAYYLLGVIIEKLSGQSYTDFLKVNIFEPLGLDETHYLDNDPIVPRRAEGYEVKDGALVNDDPLSMRLPYAAGSLGSSVHDLLRWQKALVSHQLLSAESFEKMTTPGRLSNGDRLTYGYGVGVAHLDDHLKVTHGGGINGFRAHLSYYPHDEVTVAVLTNTGSANPSVIESAIARVVLGLESPSVDEIPLSEAALGVYVGVYHPGRSPIEVRLEDGALRLGGQTLRPTGEHAFTSAEDPDARVTFTVEDGKAVELRMERQGQVTVAPRTR